MVEEDVVVVEDSLLVDFVVETDELVDVLAPSMDVATDVVVEVGVDVFEDEELDGVEVFEVLVLVFVELVPVERVVVVVVLDDLLLEVVVVRDVDLLELVVVDRLAFEEVVVFVDRVPAYPMLACHTHLSIEMLTVVDGAK